MKAGPARVVLCLGDSNTHGTVAMESLAARGRLGRAERWPGRLAGAMCGSTIEVIEEGLPGRTTVHDDPIEGAHRNALRVLPALLETHAPLDAVVMMLGTNDLKARFSVTAGDVALSVARLARMILAGAPAGPIRGAGPGGRAPRLLIVAPPPIEERGCLAEMFAGGAAKGRRLAALYKGVAETLGADFLDAGAVVAVSGVDGVHLDAAAHAALALAVAQRLDTFWAAGQAAPRSPAG